MSLLPAPNAAFPDPPLAPGGAGGTAPDLVSDWVDRPDFPKGALGACLDIGGYVGTVVAVVGQSLKVRSEEGVTRSFNAHGLKRIYGARQPVEPIRPLREEGPVAAGATGEAVPEEPAPEEAGPPLIEPDFNQPLRSIAELALSPDFPANTLGKLVDVSGYAGVVVQIVRQSLKIRSSAGVTRSYNAPALRKLHRGS